MAPRVPDAWDDDDFDTASSTAAATTTAPSATSKPTRAERRAQHAEANRALWHAADTPREPFHFLDSRPDPPLRSAAPPPAVTVLSRKPAPIVSKPKAAGSGAAGDDDDTDSDEEARRARDADARARAARARAEREEKARKYNEVRSRLFGAADEEVAAVPQGGVAAVSRGSNGRRGAGGRAAVASPSQSSSGEASPARTTRRDEGKVLFDPDYAARPGSAFVAGGARESPHVRAPRGPDANGRGGFAARRGRGGGGTAS